MAADPQPQASPHTTVSLVLGSGGARELVGNHAIEELPVWLTAVAMDIATGKEVWLRQVDLFNAIRASIATPLLVTPYRDGERMLIDGGVVNPVPIARLKLAASSPDVMVELPPNACGFSEFRRGAEMIALGRERSERASARAGRATPGAAPP
ncbi:MAG: hypothetical protein FJY55_12600 [Betaproteobacteria bacterium]|nr:hypothetical protein [Betaproteobacteria bacterium]